MSYDLIATTAHVAVLDRASADLPHDDLVKLAEERSTDPAVFEDHPPVFFLVNASNTELDAYFTRMDVSTLKLFATDAAEGVAVLDSHDTRSIFGQSVTGDTKKDGDTTLMRSAFYTIPDWAGRSGNSNDFINGIKAGLYRDVSVGFRIPRDTGMIECSICGGNMMNWAECPHWPGMSYDVEGDGNKAREVATGTIIGGRLSEYSLVYDGATPGAGVVKGLRMAEAGDLSPEMAATLEHTYNRSFPVHRSHAVPLIGDKRHTEETPTNGKENGMDIEVITKLLADRGFRVRAGSTDEQVIEQLEAHLSDLDRDVQNGADRIKELEQENQRLAPLAEDGEQYRRDVVAEALQHYVRSLPPDQAKNADTGMWERAFESMELADIQKISADWESRSQFEEGSQHRKDGTDEAPPRTPKRRKKSPTVYQDA